MAEISETKTPQPGEYWVSDDGSIIRIVGTKLNGHVIYENQAGFSFQFNSMTNWRHEPRCTGFDWVEPKLLTPGEGYEWVQQDDMKGVDMIEIKTPHAGEYWLSGSSLIAYVVGFTIDGDPAWQQKNSRQILSDKIGFFLACFHHEPRCDSFDWTEPPAIEPGEGYEVLPDGEVLQEGDQFKATGKWRKTKNAGQKTLPGWTYRRKIKPVETWPKYYICDTWVLAAYILRKSSGPLVIVNMDGSVEKPGRPWQEHDEYQYKHGFYREVTEAEALARVKPDTSRPTNIHGTANDADETLEPCAMCGDVSCDCDCYKYAVEATGCPVESPDDWVEITNRDHKLRAGIDEFRNAHEWAFVRDSHGKTARQAGFLNVRCRRKDLPVLVTCTCPTLDGVPVTGSSCPIHGLPSCELQPAAKRVPVRLWINGDDGVVFQSEVHVNADDQEIKHDADGFYVEGSE